MGSILGFTLTYNLTPEEETRARAAEQRALAQFSHLETSHIQLGKTTLNLWGRAPLTDRTHKMPNGETLALVGSPHNQVAWNDVEKTLLNIQRPADFQFPWEGRATLIKISADGNHWTVWNDWLGSIPAYHTATKTGRVLSTLEPVSVATAGFTPDDFFLPGLVSLLLNGHFISDWTLYKNLKTIPADSLSEWNEKGYRSTFLGTVLPSQDRWETPWDEMVDEMHALSHKAISNSLKTQPHWLVPLSAGLDSRLIAAVAADTNTNIHTYAWGEPNVADVVYSRQIAQAHGFPWKHIQLKRDFLLNYTKPWANMFGTSMHFQGMYLMHFLDQLAGEPAGPIMMGFLGDVLAGSNLKYQAMIHAHRSYNTHTEWMSDFTAEKLQAVAKFDLKEALEINADTIKSELDSYPGVWFQKLRYLQLRNRQRLFICFLPTLMDYWRGVSVPYLDRSYARFALSLPRAPLDDRRLLGDVIRRYYGKMAVIPGSYASDPYIVTGKYIIQKRLAKSLPASLRNRFLKGFGNVQIGVDFPPIQAHGKASLWPLYETWEPLDKWLDLKQVESDYQAVMQSNQDPRPLRRLQAAQTLAAALHPHVA